MAPHAWHSDDMQPLPESEPADEHRVDATLDSILTRFRETHRLDHAHGLMRRALCNRLEREGYSEAECHLLEVNLFGSLSGWMEFVLKERMEGRDAVPDFARHLRRAFLVHCRASEVEPDAAVQMAIELATVLMDVALGFQKHLHIEGDLSPPEE